MDTVRDGTERSRHLAPTLVNMGDASRLSEDSSSWLQYRAHSSGMWVYLETVRNRKRMELTDIRLGLYARPR